MSKDSGRGTGTVAELKAAAEDLLRFLGGQEMSGSELFPYGVTAISIRVKSGDEELTLEVGGPDQVHSHDGDEDDWYLESDPIRDLDDDL